MSIELTAGQQAAAEMTRRLVDDEEPHFGILTGYAGTGKALAFDQAVQTPKGPVPIEGLRLGDEVIGSDGRPTIVVGVFPQGVRQAYRVTFRDGASVECDTEHLWAVWTHKNRQKKASYSILPLKDIVSAGIRFKSGPHKFSVPLCAPVQLKDKQFPIDPYLLGLLIGDGTSLGKTPTLCVPDLEIELVKAAIERLPLGMEMRVNRAPTCPQWRFIDPTQRGNRLASALRSLGLGGVKSPSRFIPQEYLLGSVQQRYSLLRGLMDTDGSCNAGNRSSFCTHSEKLARDVVSLVQSLGGTAIPKLDSRGAWAVNVKTWEVPFCLKRKVANWRLSRKNPPSRFIVSIEPTRKCEHVCIKVTAPDGLFLTEGFIVTHNTTMLKNIAEEHGNPLVLTPTGKASLRVTEATGLEASTAHRWLYKSSTNQKTGEPQWTKKPVDELALPSNGLIVIDEASMVGEDLWLDIWGLCSSIGLRVLLVGDTFQLPPVTKKSEDGEWKSFSALKDLKTSYRADLTEVVRQALDNPIIRASMMLRAGEMQAMDAVMDILPSVRQEELVGRFLAMAEGNRALIAHRNITRQSLNLDVRKALGYDSRDLVEGEPLLVLFNNYNLDRFNGEVVAFSKWNQVPDAPIAVRDRYKNLSTMMGFGIADIEGQPAILSPEEVFALTEGMPETTVARAARQHAMGEWGYEKLTSPSHLNANLGYALTCHKAQGSEWDDVMVVVEPSLRNPYSYEGRRWLYTALTRARKNVTLCFTSE